MAAATTTTTSSAAAAGTTTTTTTTSATTTTTSRRWLMNTSSRRSLSIDRGGVASRSNSRSNPNLESVRPPIVLEIGSSIIRFGYAGNSTPTHIIPVHGPAAIGSSSSTSSTTTKSYHSYDEAEWYTILSPWIEAVYDRLLCPPKTRKVLVIHTSFYLPTAYQRALEQIFWNMGTPSLSFVSGLEIIPLAQGWKRGFIIHMSQNETVCVCHSDGHILPYTYQCIPECGYGPLLMMKKQSKKDDKDTTTTTTPTPTLQREWTPSMDYWLLDEVHNPNSLMVGILKSLEACPRDIRGDVAYNILVCGDGGLILPDFGRKVIQRLEQILEGTQEELTLPQDDNDDDPTDTTTMMTMTATPISIPSLKPLANRLRLLQCTPYHRPDFMAWIGGSLWAATWNRYRPNESRIQWKETPFDS